MSIYFREATLAFGHNMGKKLRTLHIGTGHIEHDVRIYQRICLSLAKHGYKVSLLAHPDGQPNIENDGIDFQSLGSLHLKLFKWNLFKRWRRCVIAYKIALRASKDFDIFHFYSPEFIPWAIKLRKKTKKPVIMDCMEDFDGHVLMRPNIPDLLRPILARLVRYGLYKASQKLDAITVADHGTGDKLQKLGARVIILHNFPKLESFPRLPPVNKEFDLVFHGGMYKITLRTFLEIDDILVSKGTYLHWYLIGYLEEPDWFRHEIANRNATERFILHDPVPHAQVIMLVRKARIGIIPLPNLKKYHSNIPQKMFEFMALEMPVVLSDLPPCHPFVGDGSCALTVEPDNAHAYAEAILKLLSDTELCSTMGAEGRRRIEYLYNWESEVKKLFALYEEFG